MLFLLLFGRGTGVHSLTGLPGSALKGPTTKTTKQQQNTHTHTRVASRTFLTENHGSKRGKNHICCD